MHIFLLQIIYFIIFLMNKSLIVPKILFLLPFICLTKWIGPISLLYKYEPFVITSLFRDQESKLNHVFYSGGASTGQNHMAVSDEGKIIYQTQFSVNGYNFGGIIFFFRIKRHIIRISEKYYKIKGKDDGKNLF